MSTPAERAKALRESLSWLRGNHEILEEGMRSFAKLEAAYYKTLVEEGVPVILASDMAIAYIDATLRGINS